MPEADELTIAEVARALGGKSWAQIYRLLLLGELEGRQVAGRWQITRRSVRRLLEKGRAPVAASGS